MGLDIYCGDVSSKVGSYISVHIHRKILLKCVLYYVQYLIDNRVKTKPTICNDELNRLKEHLEKMLICKEKSLNISNISNKKVLYYVPIDYDYYENNDNDIYSLLQLFNIEGVLYFIIHNDCEGEITSSESKDFINFLSLAIPKSLPYFEDEKNKKPIGCQDENNYSIFNLFNDDYNINCNNYNDFDKENIYKHYYLYNVFQESINSGKNVVFC